MTKRRSPRYSSLIPMTFLVTPRIKANLEKRAKETGCSVSHVGSLLLDWEEMEKTARRIVHDEVDRLTEPVMSFMKSKVNEIDEIKRILNLLFKIPFEGIDKIIKKINKEKSN